MITVIKYIKIATYYDNKYVINYKKNLILLDIFYFIFYLF